MALTVKTNNVPRNLIYGYELSEKERKEFDYISAEDLSTHEFFRYKGNLYDPSDFMRVDPGTEGNCGLKGWDGYESDSYFSGIVIKYRNDFEQVIVGFYCS
jgi:hypothetical protein